MPGSTVELARDVTDPARGELDMVFTFEHVGLDAAARAARKWALAGPAAAGAQGATSTTWQEGLAEVGWNSLYWDNHDQPRAVSRFGDDSPEHRVASAKTLGTVLHLHRGTPYVYQGEELGMTNAYFTAHRAVPRHRGGQLPPRRAEPGAARPRRCCASLAAKGRDNARTPMQWDDSEHAGFTTGEPWLPANPNKDTDQRRPPRSPTRTRCSTTTAG